MDRTALLAVFLCPACGARLAFQSERRLCCTGDEGSRLQDDMLVYDPHLVEHPPAEMVRRDAQARGYMQHSKFPTQVDRLRRFIDAQPPSGLVLDLGCGPGPTTAMLQAAGFDVAAVDFSAASLRINRGACPEALFVQADLTALRLAPRSVDGVMMADFLQHLPSAEAREIFLQRAFRAVKPGGWFFLSFFNVNLVNWLKGDIHGAFAEGAIRYTRLPANEVRRAMPSNVEVRTVSPMNISSRAGLDRIASAMPFAHLLSRMTVMTGIVR